MDELSKQYNPKEVEEKWYDFWLQNNLFAAKSNKDKKPYCIVIPPPNVTGILHMGHALNNTIQDILIRYHRMRGEEALWMPGTDHAGIATQNVVEKSLAKEGLRRQDLGRDEFIQRVWKWKEQYGSTIIRQLKKLGASCDWPRLRFTMDDEYSVAVRDVFIQLYEKGLIYRGHYIINWCPRCQTALSDEEAPHQDIQGNLYYFKYPLEDTSLALSHITVATTRPETMLGDTAVAVNPKDKRYKKYIGKRVVLPLINRSIPIIADEMVDVHFGTGAVKVTPAHDPNDYVMGKKHSLEFINVMNTDGSMNEHAGAYKGMDRYQARQTIVRDLEQQGLLDKTEPHALSAGHCYRCNTIIEPYYSKQWFVKMKPLSKPAIEAVKKGEITFHPKRWTKVYLNWMENIQDWCISRQIWWGHRLPVWYCKNCDPGVIVSAVKPAQCPHCHSTDLQQDNDVLDTWFSSWLWPFATFGWPFAGGKISDPEGLKYFYPTSALVTAPEIIFFWVARMIMAGFEFMGDIPFKDVYIHGTVRDITGKKMSKSLGNIIDPLEIIDQYGTDALRFSLMVITSQGQDVFLAKERFEQGRNFANKIWNASRFILMNVDASLPVYDGVLPDKKELSVFNRWILSRLQATLLQVNKALEQFKFNEAAGALYAFFWHEVCDWYLELIKQDIRHPHNQRVMQHLLQEFLVMAHPFMPFVTEEIWHRLPRVQAQLVHLSVKTPSLMIQPWPEVQKAYVDRTSDSMMRLLCDVVITIRNMRAEIEVPVLDAIDVTLATQTKAQTVFLTSMVPYIQRLCKVKQCSVVPEYNQSQHKQYVRVVNDIHIIIPLVGIIDVERYIEKVNERIQKAEAEIAAKQKLLSNQQFVAKAPEEIVEKERARLAELGDIINKLKAVCDAIK